MFILIFIHIQSLVNKVFANNLFEVENGLLKKKLTSNLKTQNMQFTGILAAVFKFNLPLIKIIKSILKMLGLLSHKESLHFAIVF